MDWVNNITTWLHQYAALGPLPGILVPMLESFLPILPLIAIVIGNAAAYGLWEGFLYSWIGVIIGSISVFWISRTFGKRLTTRIMARYPQARSFFNWIEKKGFGPIFLLACFPFSPSFLVNVVSGLTVVPIKTFVIAILLGKAIMIFFVSFIGHDISSFLQDPVKIISTLVLIAAFWLLGKKLESSLRK